MSEVTEVVTKFSFTGSTQPLSKYNEKLGTAIKGLGAMATATAGALAGLAFWADGILKGIDPIAQMSRQTGVAVEAIQELGFAASVNGGSMEAMSAGLERLNGRIGEAVALGSGEGVKIFEQLGIDLETATGKVKSADKVFDEMRQRVVELGLSQQEISSFAEKLGLDPSSVQLLMKTNQEMSALKEESRDYGILTKEQIDATADYNDSMTRLGTAFKGVKQQIAVGFAPELKNLADKVTTLIRDNRELISDVLTKGITVLGAVASAFGNVAMSIFDVTSYLLSFKPVLFAVIGLAGGLMLAFAPITSIVVGVTALVLIVDDLMVAFTGGKSVIGDFFKSFGVDLTVVTDMLKEMWRIVKEIFSFDFGAITDAIGGGISGIKGFFTSDEMAGGDSVSNVDNRSVSQEIRIDVHGSNADESARAVYESLQKQMQDAQAQTGNGGR